ncbi:MAG: hypothetical protein K9M07_07180 [Simkaniaceae bacterium]|nr:hypothetical protein [Simkaniaceae bacterium]MCF7853004.1 hypothetical protein [Simkaniaceae bacterium]
MTPHSPTAPLDPPPSSVFGTSISSYPAPQRLLVSSFNPIIELEFALRERNIEHITYLLSTRAIPENIIYAIAHRVAQLGDQTLLSRFLSAMDGNRNIHFFVKYLSRGPQNLYEMIDNDLDRVIAQNCTGSLPPLLPFLSPEQFSKMILHCAENNQGPLLNIVFIYLRIAPADILSTIHTVINYKIAFTYDLSEQITAYESLIQMAQMINGYDIITPIIQKASPQQFCSLVINSIIENRQIALAYLLRHSDHPVFFPGKEVELRTVITNAFYFATEMGNDAILHLLFSIPFKGVRLKYFIDTELFDQLRHSRALNPSHLSHFIQLLHSS